MWRREGARGGNGEGESESDGGGVRGRMEVRRRTPLWRGRMGVRMRMEKELWTRTENGEAVRTAGVVQEQREAEAEDEWAEERSEGGRGVGLDATAMNSVVRERGASAWKFAAAWAAARIAAPLSVALAMTVRMSVFFALRLRVERLGFSLTPGVHAGSHCFQSMKSRSESVSGGGGDAPLTSQHAATSCARRRFISRAGMGQHARQAGEETKLGLDRRTRDNFAFDSVCRLR